MIAHAYPITDTQGRNALVHRSRSDGSRTHLTAERVHQIANDLARASIEFPGGIL